MFFLRVNNSRRNRSSATTKALVNQYVQPPTVSINKSELVIASPFISFLGKNSMAANMIDGMTIRNNMLRDNNLPPPSQVFFSRF